MGIVPMQTLTFIRNLPGYFTDYQKIKNQLVQTGNKSLWPVKTLVPVLHDKADESGILKGAYFHQDLLVAKKIFKRKPAKHVDIGSRTDGFVAHVSIFMPIEVIDIRPQSSNVENIHFLQADLMSPLPSHLIGYSESVSSLHAIEHFGLGRYGDPLDVNGYKKALDNIYQMLKDDGVFYFSVPLGGQRIEFNAHRIFSLQHLLSLFEGKYSVLDFSYVDDTGDLHANVPLSKENIASNCNCNYGCAIFELQKNKAK